MGIKKIAIIGIILVALIIISTQIFKLNSHPTLKLGEKKSSSITIKGSDTEVQMVSNIAEAFAKENPDIKLSVTGGGSGVGIAGLLNKEIDMANSSRLMKDAELQQAKDKNLSIKEFIVARDGITIIVNPENPVKKLNMEQLGKIYKGQITNWQDVGGKEGKIILYGRQSTSGTYSFFRDVVVKDDYSPDMKTMEGNEAIVDSVKSDKAGIGYVGVGYVKDANGKPRTDLSILSLSKDATSSAISPLNVDAVKRGSYPIFRAIYQYLPNMPQKDSGISRFLKFEASDKGQQIVERSGFYTLTREDILHNKQLLQ